MSGIQLGNVTKVYANGVNAVDELSLDIGDGEFMVLVGPSGCGKSTLLRMIAGLESVTHGSVRVGGRDVTHLQPRDRDIAMVFQNYALYPHMTVWRNLAFALRLRKAPRDVVDERVDEVAGILGLKDLFPRRPARLSGGQRQRVAMGRAMVREPKAFLMDEPLSNLDAKLRVAMRAELSRLHDRLGTTTVYVTHDQVEAMTLGDRVAVLRDGVLQQCAPPRELFDRPANVFVAAFIGSPAMNLVNADVVDGAVRFGGYALQLPPSLRERPRERRVVVGIRPSDLMLASDAARAGEGARMNVTADVVEELGDERHVVFLVDAPRPRTDAIAAAVEAESREDEQLIMDDERARFTARLPSRVPIAPGERLELAVDTARIQLFDIATGESLAPADAGPPPVLRA